VVEGHEDAHVHSRWHHHSFGDYHRPGRYHPKIIIEVCGGGLVFSARERFS